MRIIEPPKILRCPDAVSFEEGESAKVKIFFQSETPCTARVFRGKEEVKESDRFKWNVFDDYVVLLSKEMEVDDNGKYRIEVSNESGSADASFPIKVTGKPGAPTGPLRISDISQHQCTLFWKPPEKYESIHVHPISFISYFYFFHFFSIFFQVFFINKFSKNDLFF